MITEFYILGELKKKKTELFCLLLFVIPDNVQLD